MAKLSRGGERPRTPPGEEEPEFATTAAEIQERQNEASADEAAEIASRMAGMEIEDWLEGLADEQIGAWVHYCYRTEPLPKGVRPICIYRNKPLAELVDGDGVCNLRAFLYNHEFGGGGCYRIHVMPPGKGQRPNIANGNIRLPGAPKLIPAAANPALPAVAAAQTAGTGDAVSLRILDKLDDLGRSRADDPMTQAAGKVMSKALDSFVEGNDKPAGITGNPSLDSVLVPLMVKALTPPPTPPVSDPFETYMRIRNAVKEMVQEAQPPAPAVQPGRASELVELVKAGGPQAIELAKAIYGNPAEPGGFGSAAGEALSTLIRDRPQAIGQAWDLITHGLSTVLAKLSGPVTVQVDEPAAPPPPARLAAANPNPFATQGQEADAPAASKTSELGPPQEVIDDIFGIVVANFRRGLDGTTVGIIILGAFPKMQPFLQMVCANDLATVLPELRQQQAIAPIVDDPRFAAFYAGFREMCLSGLPMEEDFAEAEMEGDNESATVTAGTI